MPDSLPPVAIRVARPYATEEELLENELDTLTRTSVTLLGAPSRPQGLVLRFELVLSSGQVLMRGEGRVVGYKPNAHRGMAGLTLRFTRLDTRSKTVVDRATALRERRRPSASAPALADGASTPSLFPAPSLLPEPSIFPSASMAPRAPVEVADELSSSTLLEEAPDSAPQTTPSLPVDDGDPLPEPDTDVVPWTPVPTQPVAMQPVPMPPWSPPAPASLVAPRLAGDSDREALLERLRVRSKSLGQDALQKLIERQRG